MREKAIQKEVAIHGINVTILGTAHVSSQSVLDVESLYSALQPEYLAIELCPSRLQVMKDGKRWQNMDLSRAIREKKIWLLFASLLLHAVQKKIGESSGLQAGAEMRKAIELSESNEKVQLHCIDREISTTMRRAWHRVSFWSRLSLISDILGTLFVSQEFSQQEIDDLRQEDVLSELMRSLPAHAEGLKRVILTERDSYMAQKIWNLLLKRPSKSPSSRPADSSSSGGRHSTTILPVDDELADDESADDELAKNELADDESAKAGDMLVIVGAAHVVGIFENLKRLKQQDAESSLPEQRKRREEVQHSALQDLEVIPAKKKMYRFIVPASGLLGIGITAWFFKPSLAWETIQQLLVFWILARSLPAAAGAALAKAHIGTVAVTMLLAPLSYFLGFFGFRLWMGSALTQLSFRKPQVRDFEELPDDLDSSRNSFFVALYRNKIVNLIWLIWLVSLGLTIGNFIFVYIVVELFTT